MSASVFHHHLGLQSHRESWDLPKRKQASDVSTETWPDLAARAFNWDDSLEECRSIICGQSLEFALHAVSHGQICIIPLRQEFFLV